MHEQRIFDIAYKGMARQGWQPSVAGLPEDPICMYVDSDTGNRCAVGHLIAPDQYSAVFEGLSAIVGPTKVDEPPHLSPAGIAAAKSLGIPEEEMPLKLLRQLQLAHDGAAFAEEDRAPSMRERFESLARCCGLTIPEGFSTQAPVAPQPETALAPFFTSDAPSSGLTAIAGS